MARAKLASLWDNASGGLGPYVVAPGKGGLVVRRRPVFRRHKSPDQPGQEARFAAMARVWAELTPEQARAWDLYAGRIVKTGRIGGKAYSPSGYNAFTALALVRMRLDPGGPVPFHPPAGSFTGDKVQVTVTPEPGALRFHASGPNRAGIVTELMLQRLVTPRRKPTTRYKSVAFVSFDAAHGHEDIPVEPGAYACAYRFIERATGRVTVMQTLGVVIVA